MKLVCLALVVVLAVGSSANNCHWGPSYWCQSQQNAKECDTVQYCQEKVWIEKSTGSVAQSQGIECSICELAVNFIAKELANNSTEDEVKQALLEFCEAIGPLKSECTDFVNDEFDALWNIIINDGIDQACSILGVCSSSRVKAAAAEPRPLKKTKLKSISCTVCETVAKELIKLVDNNSTKKEAKIALKMVCVYLGGFAPECRLLIDTLFDELWDKATSFVGNATFLCAEVNLCSAKLSKKTFIAASQVSRLPVSRSARVGAGACDLCELVVTFLKPFVDNNSTEEEIEAAIEALCNALPSGIKDECTSLVDQFFPLIWALVEGEFENDEICTTIGLCNSTKTTRKPSQTPVMKSAGLQKARLPVAGVGAAGCDICKLVVNFIKPYVDGNSTEAEVKEALETICSVLPSSLKTECNDTVEKYFDLMWLLLKTEVDSGEICKQIGLCNTTKITKQTSPVSVQKSVQKSAGVGDSCDICKTVVNFLRPFADSNTTEAEVKEALVTFCAILPSAVKTECNTIVDLYFKLIWDIMKAEVDSGAVCRQIGLCNSTKITKKTSRVPVSKSVSRSARVGDELCDVCELAVTFLKPYVDNNSTKDEVKAALETICGLLPSPYNDECTSLIDTNFEIIWALVKSEIDNDLICTQLGLCNATKTIEKTSRVPVSKSVSRSARVGDELCDICQLAVTFLKPYVDSNATEAEVKAAMETVCGLLPSPINDECTTAVDQYFDFIWALVKAGIDNGEICTQLKLCNATKTIEKMSRVPVSKSAGVGDACATCKTVVSFLKPFVDSSSTEAEVKAKLKAFCSVIPSPLKDQCNYLVDTDFDFIWDLVKDDIDGGYICNQLTLCKSTKVVKKVEVKSTTCDVCKFVVRYLREMLDSNATESEAKAMIEGICKEAGPLKGECDDMLDQYFPMIWKLLQSYADDSKICAEIDLCSTTFKMPQVSIPRTITVKVQKPNNVGGVFCMVCELVMKEVTSLLDGNDTKEAIEDALKKVCSITPSSFEKDCDEFVDKYAPEIIDLIVSGTAAKLVCAALGLCLFETEQYVSADSTGECTVCKAVVGLVKTELENKSAEDKVDGILENLCVLVPNGIRDECKTIVETFGPQLIQLLDKEIEPDAICSMIKLCA